MDFNGICYYEILDEKQAVNKYRYIEFLGNLTKNWHINKKHEVWLLDYNVCPIEILRLDPGWSQIKFKYGYILHILQT